jgi:L-asparaginase II
MGSGAPPGSDVLVRVVRSGVEESVHRGDVAVCDADGRLLAWAGVPDREVFARSCMKPLQAAVSVAAIGNLRLTPEQLAVMAASHNGEPVHRRTVRGVLSRAGLGPDDLGNPAAFPADPLAHARAGRASRIAHNCSGKHAGMLLACWRQGWAGPTYLRRSHPLQRRVTAAVAQATGVAEPRIGVDGCGVPVHAVSLRAMATLYARLTRPERLDGLAEPASRVVDAMRRAPYLVGGRGRLDTDAMTACPGLVVREGAEALTCAAVPGTALGVAVKVRDGGYRAVEPALMRVLGLIGALDRAQEDALAAHARPPVRGGGRPVGEMVARFDLRRG